MCGFRHFKLSEAVKRVLVVVSHMCLLTVEVLRLVK